MKRSLGRISLVLVALLVVTVLPVRAEAPAGQLTWGVPVSLPPAWFDPADATGILIPFMVYYALHDALVFPTNLREAPHPGRVVREGRG